MVRGLLGVPGFIPDLRGHRLIEGMWVLLVGACCDPKQLDRAVLGCQVLWEWECRRLARVPELCIGCY